MYDELIQEMEKKEYLMEVNKINNYSTEIRIKKRNDYRIFYFHFVEYFCVNHFISENGLSFDVFEKEVFWLLISHIKKIHQNKPFFFSLQGIEENSCDKLKESLQSVGYQYKENDKCMEKIGHIISNHNFYNSMGYKDDYEKLNNYYLYITELYEQVEILSESERLFERSREKEMSYQIYYHGFEGYLILEVGNSKNVMRLEKENKEVLYELFLTNVEEIKSNLKVWFKSLKEKQRIKNLLDPPRYFFNNWIRYNARECNKEKIYESLKKFMNPFEIEEMMADWDKKEVEANGLGFGVEFYIYENHIYIFLLDQDEVCRIEKQENWKEELIKKVLQIKQESMEEKLKDIN